VGFCVGIRQSAEFKTEGFENGTKWSCENPPASADKHGIF